MYNYILCLGSTGDQNHLQSSLDVYCLSHPVFSYLRISSTISAYSRLSPSILDYLRLFSTNSGYSRLSPTISVGPRGPPGAGASPPAPRASSSHRHGYRRHFGSRGLGVGRGAAGYSPRGDPVQNSKSI